MNRVSLLPLNLADMNKSEKNHTKKYKAGYKSNFFDYQKNELVVLTQVNEEDLSEDERIVCEQFEYGSLEFIDL